MRINFIFTIKDILVILSVLFIFSIFIFCKICDKQKAKRKSEQDNKDDGDDSSLCCYSGVKCYSDDCATCKERIDCFKEDNNGR